MLREIYKIIKINNIRIKRKLKSKRDRKIKRVLILAKEKER